MSKALDENDKLKAGLLPKDPREGTAPVNRLAEEADEKRPLKVYRVDELLRDANERARLPLSTVGVCATGNFPLDDATGGFCPGFVWVMAADSSWGKSSWMIATVDEIIKQGKRALIISFEDAPVIYGNRLMARRARVSAQRIKKHINTKEELEKMAEVAAKAEDCPVYIEAGNRPIERLVQEVRAQIRSEKIDWVGWDYLQEAQSEERHQDERFKYKHIAKLMREVIKSEQKTGVILSQITVSETTKIPTKQNIRDCRDVAHGADVICIGFTPDEDIFGASPGNDESGRKIAPETKFKAGQRYLLIDKNKDGPKGKKIVMSWDDHSACFNNVEDPQAGFAMQFDDFDDDFDNPRYSP